MTRRTCAILATILVLPAFALATPFHEQVLHSFLEDDNGAYPTSSLAIDSNGHLYGTAELGGASGAGTIFELTPEPGGGWNYTLLHGFNGSSDGSSPRSGLLLGKSGMLYGTAVSAGSTIFGTAFELSPDPSGWTYTVIYNFAGGDDAGFPSGTLISDAHGNLYGTSSVGGGSSLCTFGCGTVFQLQPSRNGQWTETVLYRFQGGPDGAGPLGTLARDAAGNLYGVTAQGGSAQCSGGCGTAFKLHRTSSGGWQKQTFAAFIDKQHGWFPTGGLTLAGGNLYGTTSIGGDLTCNPPNGCGTLFKLNAQGQEVVVHSFVQDGRDGFSPQAGLTTDGAGHLFGTTVAGGRLANGCGAGCGIVFAVDVSGNLKTLYEFKGGDGAMPEAPLLWDGKGHIYGTTLEGGTGFAGTVFELTR